MTKEIDVIALEIAKQNDAVIYINENHGDGIYFQTRSKFNKFATALLSKQSEQLNARIAELEEALRAAKDVIASYENQPRLRGSTEELHVK
jgi:hypothetical protein